MHHLQKNIVANASILREHGVSPSTISQLLTCYPSVMALNVDKFAKHEKKAIGMEFNLSSSTFVHGLQALTQMNHVAGDRNTELPNGAGSGDDQAMPSKHHCASNSFLLTAITKVFSFFSVLYKLANQCDR
ncbi:hypothetical protein LWI28_026770 [Acer negundo]|uniref:Uncharacterized protein n=1 Tax=Acer negundo TaxID=4023 RepID=A0AAD5J394_ACENE|nr:hypothetical protein LWI28_026770 [Acer negundo]